MRNLKRELILSKKKVRTNKMRTKLHFINQPTKKDILEELENIKQDIDIHDIEMKLTEIQWAINVHLRETGDL